MRTRHYKVGTLVMDIVDYEKRQSVYQGGVEGIVSKEMLQDPRGSLTNAVARVFEGTRSSPAVRARRACLQVEDYYESVARKIPRVRVGTTAPAQPAADSPPIDEALRESLAREFHVLAGQVESIYREELRRLAAGARINTFLGVLATRLVRARLGREPPPAAVASPGRSLSSELEPASARSIRADVGPAAVAPESSASTDWRIHDRKITQGGGGAVDVHWRRVGTGHRAGGAMFQLADGNGDGLVTREEVLAARAPRAPRARQPSRICRLRSMPTRAARSRRRISSMRSAIGIGRPSRYPWTRSQVH